MSAPETSRPGTGGRLRRHGARAFVLLECMLAVTVFALGALALAKCSENLVKAEKFRREEALAQRALTNYWAQIETGALPLGDQVSIPLEGAWDGMTMKIVREPLKLLNEKEQEIFGLYQVQLQLTWNAGGEEIARELSFMIFPRPR